MVISGQVWDSAPSDHDGISGRRWFKMMSIGGGAKGERRNRALAFRPRNPRRIGIQSPQALDPPAQRRIFPGESPPVFNAVQELK
jgi:hypothetical protein